MNFEGYQVQGRNITFKIVATLDPTIKEMLGASRWFEKYESPPLGKKVKRRMRLTLIDGLLSLLRSLRDNSLLSVISQGEASIVHMALFSPEARQSAYRERSVKDSEAETLEEVAKSMEFSVFIAPLMLPKAAFAQARDFMPEINVVNVGQTKSVVVIPTRDANAELSRVIGKTIHGTEVVNVAFPGPAYKTLPQGLVLDSLNRDAPVVHPGMPPKKFREIW